MTPDRDIHMKAIMDQFQGFKKSKTEQNHEKAIISSLELIQNNLGKLYKTHKLHAVLYGAYEDPEFMKGPFTYANSNIAKGYQDLCIQKNLGNSQVLERFVLSNAARSDHKDTTSLPRKQVVSSNSEAQLAPSSSRQQLCNNTKKVLELKKEIRIILRDKLSTFIKRSGISILLIRIFNNLYNQRSNKYP
ncbi:hypothetical protein BD770DRAFT_108425 [Pilaira anomala]|nr:hypothetical protein BD770DRAFT_108425 [Pilaira anomala]